jgi:branched-chain amino acid transport system ATP-binding protein
MIMNKSLAIALLCTILLAACGGGGGGGKSTLLKTIAGLLKPSQGSIRFNGTDIIHLRYSEIVRQGH